MLKHFIKQSKKILAGAMAIFMVASSALSAQAYTEVPKEEVISYRMGTEAEEALYGVRTWKFDGSEGSYTDATPRKDTFEFNTMTIDATQSGNGVKFNEGSGCTQFEPTVIAEIPSAGNYTLSITAKFWSGATVTVDGKESEPQNGDVALTFKGETKDGKITLKTANNGIWVKSISVNCEKPISSEELYGDREWIFDGSEGSYTDTAHRTDIFSFNQMTIDATQSKNGVYYNPDKTCTQFEPTVTATIPAVGNYQLTITGYFYSKATVSVDGKEVATGSGDKVLNFGGAVKDGVITLVMAGDGAWIKNIKVTCTKGYDPIQSYIEDRKTDVWDFGGVEETDSGKYTNYITKSFYNELDEALFKSKGIFEKAGQYTFGDLTWLHQDSDRIYYNSDDDKTGGVHSADNNANKYKYDFEDGYISLGAYYAAGVGSSDGMGGRCVEIKNVLPGDVITAYMMVENADMDLHFLYQGSEGEQDDVVRLITKEYTKKEFTAEYAGTYKLYLNNGAGKPRFLRVTRTPDVLIKGNINLSGSDIADYQVVLEDKNSGKRINAALYQDGTFAALVPANTTLTAILTGAKGYGFTDQSKSITTQTAVVENIELIVEAKSLSVLSGTISGFTSDFDPSNLNLVLSCTDPNLLKEQVILKIAEDWTYSAEVENEVEYQLSMTGANDYELTEDIIVKLTGNDTRNIAVKAKSEYPVSGKFIGLGADAQVTEVTFTNLEDKYSYTGTITAEGYTGNLRNGNYEITAPVNGYTMVAHIVVNNAAAEKDLYYLSTAKEEIALVSDIYVGYPSDQVEADAYQYSTMREAMKACAAMNPSSEAERITVHIYPGVYREQIVVETPYLTFVNDFPDQEVLLTWYYGVGYQYYSASEDGYYNENLAFDKYSQNSVNKWGASVYLKSKATDFRAENIIFETSFNRYITKEEIEDGAQPDMKEAIRVLREEGLDVTTKSATERACALAVDADRAEFKNCTILGSQDTLFIQLNTHTYFKECFISGNTDYIFGDAVFDRCELQWYGYKDQPAGGYITAVQNQAPNGCLFL
ncbi:MAG: pectinesterase family protein, partial [Lachnospiraceae bacterium]|nr:pectinesterase family protein [Lachnospiraceae bacterium]